MCGRFTQRLSWEQLRRLADLIGQPRNLAPRYNIAPTTRIEAIRPTPAGNELTRMRWGLIPSWWTKAVNELPATFNARAETVGTKPMFRSAFKARRCIIPASGYYEWTGAKGNTHYITAHDDKPLALAGLWERWKEPESGEIVESATIVVGPANEWSKHIHERMPIILDWSQANEWMRGDPKKVEATLLDPPPEEALQEWIVSTRVNKTGVGDDDPTMIDRVAT